MKRAIIYSRVSNKEQNTKRQISELSLLDKFEVVKTFSENISGFSKSITERKELQKAITYLENSNDTKIILVHEISRLGRNTIEVLSLLKELEQKGISVYVHTLGVLIGSGTPQDKIFTQLIVTLMSQISEMESQQLSYRIKSGIQSRKAKGLSTGRKTGTTEDKEKFLSKHKAIIKYLNAGHSCREIAKLCDCSKDTANKVKKALAA